MLAGASRSPRAIDGDHPGGTIEGSGVVEGQEQAVVPERQQLVGRDSRLAHLRREGRELGSAAATRAGRVDRLSGDGQRASRRARARGRASRSPPRCCRRRPRSVFCSPASAGGFRLALRQARLEHLRRRRGRAAGGADGRRGWRSQSRKARRSPGAGWRVFPRSCAFWQTPQMSGCPPVRSRARPGYRPKPHRPCDQRPDRHARDPARRDHGAAAPRRSLATRRTSSPPRPTASRRSWSAGRCTSTDVQGPRPRTSTPSSPASGPGRRSRSYVQDERLTSVEAESRLAVRETDWRRRKARLDAAAAAVILQDYPRRQRRRRRDQTYVSPCADCITSCWWRSSPCRRRRRGYRPALASTSRYQGFTGTEQSSSRSRTAPAVAAIGRASSRPAWSRRAGRSGSPSALHRRRPRR